MFNDATTASFSLLIPLFSTFADNNDMIWYNYIVQQTDNPHCCYKVSVCHKGPLKRSKHASHDTLQYVVWEACHIVNFEWNSLFDSGSKAKFTIW